ncbi:hypothetical protein H5410_036394 [Solanum commersonii]|uniref:DUF7746 domain-containing protein n=1 Tax=Solanum commersonii TaxID=4109 RepID=A0A9J5Y571_SOLCO|nr:hypothetical protein H5410_036394 [Solanum commersonii]
MQYKENKFLSHTSHSGREITEWNIDRLAKHQIYNKLDEIGMAITTYKMRNSSDKQSATLITAEFTGTLKNWWDNYLTKDNRKSILNATAINPVIKNESSGQTIENQILEDATTTLIYNIAKKFIREPQLFQDRSLEILTNISSPKLDDFRWYKYVFLNKVMIRKNVKHRRKSYKDKHNKPHYYKRKYKKSKLDNSNTNTCWNFGKIGHRARDCRAPNKTKDKINRLELEDEIKNRLYSILDESQTSSKGSSSEDDQLNMIYSSESNCSADCGCEGAVCTCPDHSINVISSKSKEVFFDMVEHIKNPNYKKKYLIAIKDIILNQQSDYHSIKPFSMTNALNKFREQNSETTLQDLRTELVHVKKEIKEIK